MIRKLQNVYVATAHLDETVRFYRDALGLRLTFRHADRWAQFDLDGGSFAVSAAGEGSATPGGGAVVVFEVDDLETAIGVLRGHGVSAEGGVVDMGPHGRYVTVRDPGGNPIQLFQRSR